MDQAGLLGEPRFRYPGIRRAIVISTYVATTPTRSLPYVADGSRMIVCDILFVDPQASAFRVPVAQRVSEGNAEPWIPRPTTRDILRNTPVSIFGPVLPQGQPNPQGPQMPSWEHLDGDHVLVDFVGGNPKSPVIVGCEIHPSTKRRVTEGPGFTIGAPTPTRGIPFREERYVRFSGTELRVNQTGDVLIDTGGADPADPSTEAPKPGPAGGGSVQVALKAEKELLITDDTGVVIMRARKVGGQTRVSLEGGLLRSMVLGEPLRDWLLNLKVPTGVGLSGVPLNPSTGAPPVDLTIDVLSLLHQVS
jgi:hypothetical protein